MSNPAAHISVVGLDKAISRFSESESVKTSMVKRHSLPITIAERLVTVVSERLRDYLVSHHELSRSIASDLILQSRERSVISLNLGSSEQDVEKPVAQIHINKRLTPSLVLRSLCMGDIVFFEVAIAILANVLRVNAKILIHDGGRLGLKSLYTKSGMPSRFLSAVRIAIDVIRDLPLEDRENDRARYRAMVIERILSQCEDIAAKNLACFREKLGAALNAAALPAA